MRGTASNNHDTTHGAQSAAAGNPKPVHAYVVKTDDGYLYPFAGDVSLTDREDQAGRWSSAAEASDTAERLGYKEGSFRVMAIDGDASDANEANDASH